MNENNMLKNIDRIKSLSKLMSNDNSGVDTDKILNAIAAAKSMGMLTAQDNSDKKNDIIEEKDYSVPIEHETKNEGVKILKAAIPFLNREYQKNLFLAVKLMEMSNEFDMGELSLQCQSIREDNDEEQREAMLRAIRGQMNGENGRKMDIVLKMMEARRLAAKIR